MTTLETAAVPATEPRKKLGYVAALNGLRGVAVLLVMGNHLPLRQYGSLLPGGFIGVDVFFVLSGFLITTLLIQEFDARGDISLRNFYMRRALRLGPALLLLLAVICLVSLIFLDKSKAQQNCLNALIALCYASNWVRVFTKNQLGLLAHTWSLSAEEQFYIVWPFILLLLLRATKKRQYIVAVAGAMAALSWLTGIYLTAKGASNIHLCFGLEGRADTLMIGCILAVMLASGFPKESASQAWEKPVMVIAPLSLAGLVGYALTGDFLGRGIFYYGFLVVALLTATMIFDVLANPRSVIRRVLEMKWLVWIGSISYGLYLWHWTIFWGMHLMGYKGWTVVLVGVPLTFLVVLPSYYFMERPILKLKARFGAGREV